MSDPLLVELVAGRAEAFEVLYERYAARLFAAAWRMTGSHADAEDAVQEVFMAVARSHRGLGRVQDLTAYLFTALHHAAARQVARRRRRPEQPLLDIDPPAPPAAPAPPEVSQIVGALSDDRLERALRSLPLEQRQVIALKIDGGLTFAQIAAALNVSINTAASRYRYALAKLRAAMEPPT